MSGITPNPKTFTLRFKIHTATVLLYAEGITSLYDLKHELLTALKETNPTGSIETESGPIPIPDAPHEVILGKLIDANNTRGGWEHLENEIHEEEDVPLSKGKGKAPVGSRTTNGVSKVTVAGVGLTDGALIAVKFAGSEPQLMRGNSLLDEERWDIVLPQRDIDEGFDEPANELDTDAGVTDGVRVLPERGLNG